ncbi:MAG: hypothetical protein A2033_10340, partial [Bacteroidetes bacterium GWA2_31_9]
VILVIDVSGSKEFGSVNQLKKDVITEVAAVLSFSAIQNNDKIGVIFFSDKIEKFIPPKKGKTHILRIIRELINFEPDNKNTNIAEALKFLTNAIKKRSIAFLISDFIDSDYEDAIKIANRKHDLIALRVYDRREAEIPSIGMIKVKDAETGKQIWVDTSSKIVRDNYAKWWNIQTLKQKDIFSKSGVDNASISTQQDYIKPLINLFKRRGKH